MRCGRSPPRPPESPASTPPLPRPGRWWCRGLRHDSPGTRSVVTSGASVAYLTEAGEIFVGQLSRPGAARLDTGDDDEQFAADTITLGPAGILAAFSADTGQILRAELATGRVLGVDEVPDPPGDGASLTLVGQTWVMLDADSGRLWIQGRAAPLETSLLPDARLAASGDDDDEVFIADSQGLVAVALSDGAQRQVTGGFEVRGVPAAPHTLGDEVFAAWLAPTGGTLWSEASGDTPLDYAGTDLGSDPLPEFFGNGRRLILNETQSGWVWTVPAGDLVPSSQSWQIDDQVAAAESDDAVAPEVLEPKPPVAENDAFGVRAGRAITLPVLLNDHDPNDDVLSVVPASVSASAFGAPVTTDADQVLTVDVPEDASGSTSFQYRVTDGTAVDGLTSEPATVTLTVVPETENSAPQWCGTERCLAGWPEPMTAPGGTVRFPILDAFVDPDGDALYVADATVDAGPGTVTVDPAGVLTYQHPDANAEVAVTASLTVTVSDSKGAQTSRALTVSVAPAPRLEADSFAVTAIVGRAVTVDLHDRVRGGSGSPTLSAVTAGDDDSGIAVNASALSFAYTAQAPGSTVLQYTVRDGDTEQTATVRVTALAREDAELSAPPLVAFVRPNEDTTVDVLSAVSNPANLVLLLSDVRPQAAEGASLSVDPVAQSTIRASGTTADGVPGEIGVVRYTISDGTDDPSAAITGQLTVILLPAAAADPPIAVADTATVRVGGQVDIPVLANDSAPTGGCWRSIRRGWSTRLTRGSRSRPAAPCATSRPTARVPTASRTPRIGWATRNSPTARGSPSRSSAMTPTPPRRRSPSRGARSAAGRPPSVSTRSESIPMVTASRSMRSSTNPWEATAPRPAPRVSRPTARTSSIPPHRPGAGRPRSPTGSATAVGQRPPHSLSSGCAMPSPTRDR
ncbi:cadherin-like domain-containing protein [Microbacterium schleiferi]|uniref:Cadherin-like domain-containing protein n=1 Tax=Microbacterium schleiferi TaxID=69362 RepID=A0A7S8RGR3_9MICO|nr:Ig-like domain-containing protein [Microbacterium schleiferi]QPE03832.1 cadherin-like domain-containing protein [Microbacterium schleiferi]